MALTDDLERIAGAASVHGVVAAVLAAEPAGGRRLYLVALGGDDPRWLVLDDDGAAVDRREDVRDAASIIALCEIAGDVADELEARVGNPPWLASPAFLDEVGAAALHASSAFAEALRTATGAVDEFVLDVERGYLIPLR